MEHGGIAEIIATGQFPGVTGNKKGPGNSSNQYHFDKPDPKAEVLRAAKAMEDGGKMTPELAKKIKDKVAALDAKPEKKVDYQKDGHPLYD